ncbi:hypothetical protein AQUCO_04900047v1 [Aquilegia coerulea]|uniref:Uncharacterized protein n=1 Tax=Aquilegia coerulea TaxID=218851 RepID=A0A2G5CJJ0_AQUCA|nr:hypothetical protein AQUCO_04900047v1 [Aquilegia coerulea]
MEQIIKYPTKPSSLLNSLFMSTVNTAAKSLLSVASTSTRSGGVVEKWGITDHIRYMFMLMTWMTVWFLRVLMDYMPCSFLPSPHYFLTGGGLIGLGSSSELSSSSSTSTDLVVHDGYTDECGGPSSIAIGRALSHIFSLLNDMPATSRKYQFAMAMAENIVDENVRDGHVALQEINRAALSSAFARTTNLLYQSLHISRDVISQTDGWPSRILYSLPLGSYLAFYFKGIRYLSSFLPIGNNVASGSSSEATHGGYDFVKAEKFAQELLWITKKLRGCGAVDEALVQWSFASALASSSLMANPRVQSTMVIISAIMVRELAKGETEVPRMVKFRLLILWLPLFCYASHDGLPYPTLTVTEKNEMEKMLDEVISSLPVADQEIILTNWLQDYIYCNSDWPNLQKSYSQWCRTSRKLLM